MKFVKSITVELQFNNPATGNSVQFLDVPQLHGKYVQGVEAFTAAECSLSPTQNTVIADGAKNGLLMTFIQGNDKVIENLPYFTLIAKENAGIIREFKNLKININKSSAYIADATNIVSGTVALFTFYYTDSPVN